MTHSTPPEPQPGRSPLGFDEWLAVFVALISVGAILLWGLSRDSALQGFLSNPLLEASPQSDPGLPEREEAETGLLGDRASGLPRPAEPDDVDVSSLLVDRPARPLINRPARPVQPADDVDISIPAAPLAAIPFIPREPASEVEPSEAPEPEVAAAPLSFSDVPEDYWARPFLASLVQRDVLAGYPDGTFQPQAPITRAAFAAAVTSAFERETDETVINYNDVAQDYWAFDAIQRTSKTGFLRGYPGDIFQPEDQITRAEVLVALASGLELEDPANPAEILQTYGDRDQIPDYARAKIAAATQAGLVVNHPNVNQLNPQQPATRAEVAAMLHQALVRANQAEDISSEYIVRSPGS